jgi:undecaprenyl-diphosphatase
MMAAAGWVLSSSKTPHQGIAHRRRRTVGNEQIGLAEGTRGSKTTRERAMAETCKPRRIGRAIKVFLTYLRRTEAVVLLSALGVVGGVLSFATIANEMREGETQVLDQRVLLWFRQADAPERVIGPQWVGEAARDLSAMGSVAVLILVVLLFAGFLLLSRRRRAAGCVILAPFTGAFLCYVLKGVFDRGRPDLVPHLDMVIFASFPSGHSMLSAIVYLSLGGVLAQMVRPRRLKAYALASAMLLAFLVGMSRIVLGVHYPTDVLAGWAAGLAWAFLWLLIVGRFVASEKNVCSLGEGSGEMIGRSSPAAK